MRQHHRDLLHTRAALNAMREVWNIHVIRFISPHTGSPTLIFCARLSASACRPTSACNPAAQRSSEISVCIRLAHASGLSLHRVMHHTQGEKSRGTSKRGLDPVRLPLQLLSTAPHSWRQRSAALAPLPRGVHVSSRADPPAGATPPSHPLPIPAKTKRHPFNSHFSSFCSCTSLCAAET